jgi:hypothetical protein
MTDTRTGADEGVGATISQVVADAKAYGAAQVALQRETLAARFRAGKIGLVLGVVALLLVLAAVPALLVGLILSLSTLVGPLGATAIVIAATLAVAGLCGWLASRIVPRMFEPIL